MQMLFAADLCRQFGNRARHTLRAEPGYGQQELAELADSVVRVLVSKGTEAYAKSHDISVDRGVQRRWNCIFHHCRSPATVQWPLPHVRGNPRDLLYGSSRIGGTLSDLGAIWRDLARDHVQISPTLLSASERIQVADSQTVRLDLGGV